MGVKKVLSSALAFSICIFVLFYLYATYIPRRIRNKHNQTFVHNSMPAHKTKTVHTATILSLKYNTSRHQLQVEDVGTDKQVMTHNTNRYDSQHHKLNISQQDDNAQAWPKSINKMVASQTVKTHNISVAGSHSSKSNTEQILSMADWHPGGYDDYTGEHAPASFSPSMKKSEVATLYRTLQVFDRVMRKANLTYFLAGGTLLGSYRHHGIIPWDDDADVYLLSSEKIKTRRILSSLMPMYQLAVTKDRWKFFFSYSKVIRNYPWKFPFLDICFIVQNETHIWDEDKPYARTFFYHLADVFPLTLRPFGPLLLNAPRNTESVLKKTYNLDTCQSSKYSHRLEEAIHRSKVKAIGCSTLHDIYPFVHRTHTVEGINETLVIGNRTVSHYFIKS